MMEIARVVLQLVVKKYKQNLQISVLSHLAFSTRLLARLLHVVRVLGALALGGPVTAERALVLAGATTASRAIWGWEGHVYIIRVK